MWMRMCSILLKVHAHGVLSKKRVYHFISSKYCQQRHLSIPHMPLRNTMLNRYVVSSWLSLFRKQKAWVERYWQICSHGLELNVSSKKPIKSESVKMKTVNLVLWSKRQVWNWKELIFPTQLWREHPMLMTVQGWQNSLVGGMCEHGDKKHLFTGPFHCEVSHQRPKCKPREGAAVCDRCSASAAGFDRPQRESGPDRR